MENRSASRGLTTNQLKVIAIVAMVIDHCTSIFAPDDLHVVVYLLRTFGRFTAPIMCFLIAEGYYHTSNLKRYMGRLLVMAVLSHIPFALCFGFDPLRFWESTDVLFALLLGLVALAIYHNDKCSTLEKVLGIWICCLLAYSADWNYIAVLWILSFGVFRGYRRKQLLAYVAVAGLYLLQALLYHNGIYSLLMRVGVFLVLPIIWSYNGRHGKKSRLIKWGFYWFYPIHLLLLYFIQLWLR